MKNFYKIISIFLLLFCLGLFITYVTISTTFEKSSTEQLVTELPNSILQKTSQVG